MTGTPFTYNGKPYSFRQVALNYHKVRMRMPGVLATVAMNYFKDSFRRRGWRDRTLDPWARRKSNGKRDRGRAILVQSGRLRNSIRIQQADIRKIVIATSTPWAEAHNEGVNKTVTVKRHTRGTYTREKEQYTTRKGTTRTRTLSRKSGEYEVRSHSRKMRLPKRQFMGDSEIMFRKLDRATIKAVDKVFEL